MEQILGPNGQPAREKILTDLIELRKEIGGLVAEKKNGVMFPVKSAKDLAIKLRLAADKLGMPVAGAVVDQRVTNLEVIQKDGTKGPGTSTHVVCVVRFESSDGSFRQFVGSGNGLDPQDKAGGKASTYAWKDAVTKGLCLPDKEMLDTDDENGLDKEVIPKSPVKKSPARKSFIGASRK